MSKSIVTQAVTAQSFLALKFSSIFCLNLCLIGTNISVQNIAIMLNLRNFLEAFIAHLPLARLINQFTFFSIFRRLWKSTQDFPALLWVIALSCLCGCQETETAKYNSVAQSIVNPQLASDIYSQIALPRWNLFFSDTRPARKVKLKVSFFFSKGVIDKHKQWKWDSSDSTKSIKARKLHTNMPHP